MNLPPTGAGARGAGEARRQGAHHLMAPSSGVVMTHSSAETSSMATVCSMATLLPCLSSVMAKHPGARKPLMSSAKRARCLDEPRFRTEPPQRLYWTPSLTVCSPGGAGVRWPDDALQDAGRWPGLRACRRCGATCGGGAEVDTLAVRGAPGRGRWARRPRPCRCTS